jgi:monoterpene epsilon-lactone hydrolase
MTILRHGLTAADREAMIAYRARIAAHPVAITRASYDAMLEEMPSAESVSYTETSIAGVPGVWCAASTSSSKAAVLYLHGGVFVYGTAHAYRHFAGQIAARSGVPVFVADYRRAPEEPFPAALDDTVAAYRGLAAGHDARNVAVVGDSAGGGLALSLLQGEPNARCGVLFSPWTDLALTGVSIESKASDDPQLSRAALEAGAGQYLGDHDRRDPRASPLYGSARGTPAVQVHVGTAEVLLDDSLRLASRDGVEVHEWEGMPHVFPSAVGLFEAARTAHDVVAAFLRAELGA